MFSKITNDNVIKKLTEYAKSIDKQIYIVGGAVRDLILGESRITEIKDIDIASTLSLKEVVDFAVLNNIDYVIKNNKLEVVSLSSGECCYEIARMRREIYASKFTHNPTEVTFTVDVAEDAKRRDFTANSVYYATHNNSIVDPFCGVGDIEKKIVKTVLLPEQTLSVDPARIIRMIELSARFKFNIDEESFNIAKKYACNINKLSKTRLKKELERLYQTNKYSGESDGEYLNRVSLLVKDLGVSLEIRNKM